MLSLMFILFILLALCLAASRSEAKTLYTYDLTYTLKLNRDDAKERRKVWDDAHFVSSLQGIVNRGEPRLYLYFVGGENGSIDRYWLDKFLGSLEGEAPSEPAGGGSRGTSLGSDGASPSRVFGGEGGSDGASLRSDGASPSRDSEWLAGCQLEEIADLDALIERFRDDIKGLVVYDENVAATSNVASTIAGVESLACVRFDPEPGSLYHHLTADLKLPVKELLVNLDGTSIFTGKGTIPGSKTPSTGSAKCDAYIWAKEKYLDTGKCDPTRMGYYMDAYWLERPEGYVPNHTLSNHDYFIAHRAFFFDLGPWDDETPVDDPDQPLGTDLRPLQAILRSAYDRVAGKKMIHVGGFTPWDKKYTDHQASGGKHGGVPTEWRMAEVTSCFNAFVDADALGIGCMANASVYQHYPLDAQYPQKLPKLDDLRAKGFVTADGRVAPKSYVTIYVGDYDSAAWLYHKLPEMWDDPARGTIPLGWAFNPNLADRFAPGMAYSRKHKSDADFFVAGDVGAGYVNPGHLQEPREYSGLPSGVRTWAEHCKRYYKQWDLSLTGFIIDGYAPPMSDEVLDAYAEFSPAGIVAQKIGRWGVRKGMPYMRMSDDLVHGPEQSAQLALDRIAQERSRSKDPAAEPVFFIFRDILWTPSMQKALFDTIKASPRGADVEIVDPYTLMLLIKQNGEIRD